MLNSQKHVQQEWKTLSPFSQWKENLHNTLQVSLQLLQRQRVYTLHAIKYKLTECMATRRDKWIGRHSNYLELPHRHEILKICTLGHPPCVLGGL